MKEREWRTWCGAEIIIDRGLKGEREERNNEGGGEEGKEGKERKKRIGEEKRGEKEKKNQKRNNKDTSSAIKQTFTKTNRKKKNVQNSPPQQSIAKSENVKIIFYLELFLIKRE